MRKAYQSKNQKTAYMDIVKRQQFIEWMEKRMESPESEDPKLVIASALGKFEELFPVEALSYDGEMGTKIVGVSGTGGSSGDFWNPDAPYQTNKF
jgi:hypothetical protein